MAGLGEFVCAALGFKRDSAENLESRERVANVAVCVWPFTLVLILVWFFYLCLAIGVGTLVALITPPRR